MGRTIGIDLGTTNSCVAALDGSDAQVIPNAEGSRTTPSVVAYTPSGERLVGAPAKRQSVTNPERTVFSVKRFMGRRADEVSEEMKIVPYEVADGDNGDAVIVVGDEHLTPQELSAAILSKLRSDAEAYLGEEVTDAVITVPAYFNDAQRQATKDAGRIAGLNVLRILNEPTAAALAYGLERSGDQIVLVFDLGGGTFDVSVLEISDGVWEVRSTSGDNHLGGDDFDKALVDYLSEQFQTEYGVDLTSDKLALQRLYDAAERAKVELSSVQSTQINLPFITANASGPLHLDMQVTRGQLETVAADLLARLEAPTKRAIDDAQLDGEVIDHVVLVGGMSRMPSVQERVQQITGLAPHRGVNPDEVVALGAAVQGGVLGGTVKDVLLLDVTPLSLGIETRGGVFQALIERNTTIPTVRSEVFSTAVDNQPNVEIHALQGESELAIYNKTLGRFQLGVAQAPAGQPLVEVAFDIDANGIIKVSATDQATGARQEVRITGAGGLSEEEIDRLTQAAADHADEARAAREIQSAVGQAQSRLRLLARQDETQREEAKRLMGLVEQAQSVGEVDELSGEIDKLASQIAERVRREREQAAREPAPAAPDGDLDEQVEDVEVIDEEAS